MAKLTEAEVIWAKEALAKGYLGTELALALDVTRSTISKVAQGETWRHLLPKNIFTSTRFLEPCKERARGQGIQ